MLVFEVCIHDIPIGSMYGLFTYIRLAKISPVPDGAFGIHSGKLTLAYMKMDAD